MSAIAISSTSGSLLPVQDSRDGGYEYETGSGDTAASEVNQVPNTAHVHGLERVKRVVEVDLPGVVDDEVNLAAKLLRHC